MYHTFKMQGKHHHHHGGQSSTATTSATTTPASQATNRTTCNSQLMAGNIRAFSEGTQQWQNDNQQNFGKIISKQGGKAT